MNAQKTYFAPQQHALTGKVMNPELFRPEFRPEANSWGLKNIDAPLVLPLGGVNILLETDQFVHAIDFVSARAS